MKEGSMKLDEILDIVQRVSDLHPYGAPQHPETFGNYAKGWYEACRCISSLLEEKEKGL